MEECKKPHRRYELKMHVGGDTWQDVRRQVMEYAERVDSREPGECRSVTGGYSVGGHLSVHEDSAMTHERWAKDLDAYLECRRAQQPQSPEGREGE